MLTLFFVFLAAVCNAAMDVITYRFDTSIFSKLVQLKWFIDPKVSWRNKYKNGDPIQGPVFPFSTTILCAITDLWHLAKSIMLVLLYVGITCYIPIINPVLDVILCYIVFGVTFEILWSRLFIIKKK
jgi:hypothetical protein